MKDSRTANRKLNLQNIAFNYDPTNDYSVHPQVVIGELNHKCNYCDALKFKDESQGLCCSGGKIKLPDLPTPIEPLLSLLDGTTQKSKNFLRQIRAYNNCFAMTSFGANDVSLPGWKSTFKIQGQVYHRIGALEPLLNEPKKFLQIYFIKNSVLQAETRKNQFDELEFDTILKLQQFLHDNNSYVQDFKLAMEKKGIEDYKLVIRADKTPVGQHPRRFNAPTTNEVGVFLAGQDHGNRDIVIERKSGIVKRINETHRSYDALQYPLIFWQGTDGYHFLLKQTNQSSGQASNKKISSQEFYAFRMMIRENNFNTLLRYRQLLNQFIVDVYAKIESERLLFIKCHQQKLRAEDYIHLKDAMENDGNLQETGKIIVLPSSFTGSPRYFHERVQDGITYVRHYGKPDLFITFTCNPLWFEITNNLMEGQSTTDRHDLVARVFKLKSDKLLKLITRGEIFGPTQCHMLTYEWQKRGLPHCHLLVWLKTKIQSNQIDSLISAELPNPEQDPNLYNIIKNQMIHGPCGLLNLESPCMIKNKCTKKYPKNLIK